MRFFHWSTWIEPKHYFIYLYFLNLSTICIFFTFIFTFGQCVSSQIHSMSCPACLTNAKLPLSKLDAVLKMLRRFSCLLFKKLLARKIAFLRKPADIKWFIFFNSNEWPAGTDTIFYVRTFSRLVIEIRGVNQSYLSQVQHRGFLVSTSIRFLTNCRVLLLCQIT